MSCFLLLTSLKDIKASIPAGSIATDFTLTDINGQSWNLFNLLNSGKTVYIDFFATWCNPCWNYHNSGALHDLYEQYGPGGTNEIMVLFIESEVNNNLACLYGPTGCSGPNGGTQGNWVAGTPYPIINLQSSNSSVLSSYNVTYFPTVYCICPETKKVYETGQLNTAGLYSYISSCAFDYSVDQVNNTKCKGSADGNIQISPVNGKAPFSYKWSNGASMQDVYGLLAGNYKVTITDANGLKTVSSSISIFEPPYLSIFEDITEAGCDGQTNGSIYLEVSGGIPNYSYKWSSGYTNESITNLGAGVYKVTITDDGGCVKVKTYTVISFDNPLVDAGSNHLINCTNPIQNLDGYGSPGSDFFYSWSTTNGHILSGVNTLHPEVDKGGTYKLIVTSNNTGCSSTDNTFVSENFTPSHAKIANYDNLNCQFTQTVLNGTQSSSGANFTYKWSTSDGHIISGGNTNQATVDKAGQYILTVSNILSGCSDTDDALVLQYNQSTNSIILPSSKITCTNNTVTLDGTQSTAGNNIEYSWYTNNGSILSGNQTTTPIVNSAGTYYLVVINTQSLCNDTASVIVDADAGLPAANAGFNAELNCNTLNLQLDGSQSSQGNNFSIVWSTQNGNIVSGGNSYNPVIDKAGVYTIIVSNLDNGCSAISTVNINQNPSAFPDANYNYTANLLNVNFNDASTGIPSNYLWDFGDGLTSIEKNPVHEYADEGNYTVCLTTNNICGTSTSCQTFNITGNTNVPSISNIGITNATCYGSSDGCIDLSVIYGTPPFTYIWNNNLTSEDPCNIPAGNYSVTVTDANGVSVVSNNIIVNEQYYLNIDKSTTISPACNASDGSITLNIDANGGKLNYSWSQDPNLNSNVADNLPEGNYIVIVSDEHACSAETSVHLIDQGQRISSTYNPVLCYSGNSGDIDLTISGGTPPYTYLWTTGQTTEDLTNLTAGTYQCAVTDANGCIKSIELAVSEPTEITSNIDVVDSQKGKDNGSVSVDPTGGIAPYTYLWNNGANTQSIINLAPADYVITVTDVSECQKIYTITVGEIVGTNDLNILNNIILFPNPTFGDFTINAKFSELLTTDLTVLDLLGKTIYKKLIEDKEINEHVNLVGFPQGSYFVRISTDKGQHIEKLNIYR